MQNYKLSYRFLFHDVKVLSGNPTKPEYVNIETSYCGTVIHNYAMNTRTTGNVDWTTMETVVSIPPCDADAYKNIEVRAYNYNGNKGGNFLVNFGLDDFQFTP